MDFGKTEEQELLLESLREVFARHNDYEDYFKQCDKEHKYPVEACKDMVDAGFAKLGIPEELGGVEADGITQLMVAEEAFAHGWPLATWVNYSLQVDNMLTFGNQEQQEKIMKLAMQGIKPYTLGLTEPQAGSDSNAATTRADKKDGKVIINGQKTFNTGANIAPYMLCLARNYKNEKPAKDMSMYFVPYDTPGITKNPIDKIGMTYVQTFEVFFDNVEVDESALVGTEGNGFMNLMKNFEHERLNGCVSMLGYARCAYHDAVKYAGQRVQFGQTIGSFQLIQEKLTDMAIKIENMRNIIYHTAWKKEKGLSIQIDSALAKRYCARSSFEVCDDAMQILGGIGYVHDSRVSRLWRDVRINRVMAGSDEIMVHIAGRALIKEAEKTAR